MARKQEFMPDKPSISLLSRLMLTKKQQKTLFKWVFYGLFLVALSVVQDVLLSRVRLFGATTELVPCAIFLICLMEGTQRGSIFALVASFIYLRSGSAPGPHVLVLITVLATTATALTEEAVKKAIDDGIVELRERNFDEEGVIEISPAVFSVFKNCLITLSTDNPDYIKKGKVGTYDGFDVIMSNNMAKDSSHVYCDIRGKKAIAYAGQINDVEAQRSRDYFGDEVRGLLTFGAKVIDEARIQVIKVPV
jgi:hypothetical protein